MKSLIVLLSLTITANANARGVLIQCWEKGVTQSKENIIYQNDGGYINENFVYVDGVKRTFKDLESYCISWDFPSECTDTVEISNGDTVDVELTHSFDFRSGNEALEGRLYEVEIYEVFCKRTAL